MACVLSLVNSIYGFEDRTPRVYPWMNEPGGGIMATMEYIKTAHSIYYLQYHVVWVCKYRRRILNPGICGYIRKILPKLLRSIPGIKLETIGFDKDHLHMVMSIPPKYSIASVMGKLKSQSASQLRKAFPWLTKVYWNVKHSMVAGLLCKQRRRR